ncbi:MAG TPA: ABC transporter permease [Dehalococcoidia bacterium]|jgi:ABC-2 type transport system permease protein|nr:ABC transporter permease [Dehalococcoidia bacterium]
MKLSTNPTWALTMASLKMWFRDRQALFWSLFLPLTLMLIFGVLNFGSFGRIDLGVVDQSNNQASQGLVSLLKSIDVFNVSLDGTEASERQALADGNRHLVVIIPANFGPSEGPIALQVLYNQGQPREAQVGQAILRQMLDELTFTLTDASRFFVIDAQPVDSRNLRFIDFLMPGIVAMAIMQMGLFSVAFAFVQLKKQGILRRLLATPIQPASFLFAQVFTRLVVSILQTLVLIGVAVLFFDVQLVGSILVILLLALIGGAVFISMGFAISGWARSEEVAAPIANVIALPMMFLSGVFFPREAMPEVLQGVTDYLPLTYLAEALRNVAIDGATLWSQWLNLVGLAVWLAFCFVLAVRLFRWV